MCEVWYVERKLIQTSLYSTKFSNIDNFSYNVLISKDVVIINMTVGTL